MEPDISQIAALMGDPARSRMLMALMAGKALTATELAVVAEIMPQTATVHLAKLVDKQLLVVRKQGRHKYFQLHGAEVAGILEGLLNISSQRQPLSVATGPKDPEMRKARICYDHLAGELAVKLYDSLIEQAYLDGDKEFPAMTAQGDRFFLGLGANFDEIKQRKRPLCKACLDWSERRHHLAGALGKWVLNDLLAKGWAQRDMTSRVIRFSATGAQRFYDCYGL
ncbi:winged helix-turn-helix domain-containing protein [Aestuariirhabdus sp. Z084]|uniref:ArsR/SmtB family transcription factor n=1 Tax=Aestuariirhabdus haliotis TaxID=2918751 RepID=UPI00201B3F99|nr:winged helix-turn-helix domain-containing protein [Aestuariirhabdus haliotis]MCL6417063.1 winged helix-turn-helix domain-containing protein [Aestuariirhabdus haliotis]MCL6420974.1 winged helix-turn-helix domain-containing protein [Aestuariirhabdus haliotis]